MMTTLPAAVASDEDADNRVSSAATRRDCPRAEEADFVDADDVAPLVPRCAQPRSPPLQPPHATSPIPDRLLLALLLFALLGVGTLLPWNFFITARSYFEYKLRNVSNVTGQPDQAWMRATFESYLAVFSNVPGVLCVMANAAAAARRVSIAGRMVISLLLMVAMFAASAAFVLVDTDMHQTQFFWCTLVSVVLMSGSGAVMQGSLYGLAAMFPHQYIKAVTLGQASGGLIAAVAYIISLEIGSHPRAAAFLYFLLATTVLLMCLAAYLLLRRLPFVIDRMRRAQNFSDSWPPTLNTPAPAATSDSASEQWRRPSRRLGPAWRKLAAPGLGAFLALGVTLMLYPALLSSLAPMSGQSLLYAPLSCFLAFNAADLLGRLLTTAVQRPQSGWALVALSALRLLFVPLFLLCNYDSPDGGSHRRIGGLPLLFSSDAAAPLLVAAFGLTNGYLFTMCMIRGSEQAPRGDLAEAHGAVMSFCAVLGTSVGSGLSFLFTTALA